MKREDFPYTRVNHDIFEGDRLVAHFSTEYEARQFFEGSLFSWELYNYKKFSKFNLNEMEDNDVLEAFLLDMLARLKKEYTK